MRSGLFGDRPRLMQSGDLTWRQRVTRRAAMARIIIENVENDVPGYYNIDNYEVKGILQSIRGAIECLKGGIADGSIH